MNLEVVSELLTSAILLLFWFQLNKLNSRLESVEENTDDLIQALVEYEDEPSDESKSNETKATQ